MRARSLPLNRYRHRAASLESLKHGAECFLKSLREEAMRRATTAQSTHTPRPCKPSSFGCSTPCHWVTASTAGEFVGWVVALLDFTRILSLFEKQSVSFVAVTQQFNTSTSLGRLTLNILTSAAPVKNFSHAALVVATTIASARSRRQIRRARYRISRVSKVIAAKAARPTTVTAIRPSRVKA